MWFNRVDSSTFTTTTNKPTKAFVRWFISFSFPWKDRHPAVRPNRPCRPLLPFSSSWQLPLAWPWQRPFLPWDHCCFDFFLIFGMAVNQTRKQSMRNRKAKLAKLRNLFGGTYFGSYPASSGKHLVGSLNISGCLAKTCWYKRGGRELTMKVCKQTMHRLAQASFAALALAALRSAIKLYWNR